MIFKTTSFISFECKHSSFFITFFISIDEIVFKIKLDVRKFQNIGHYYLNQSRFIIYKNSMPIKHIFCSIIERNRIFTFLGFKMIWSSPSEKTFRESYFVLTLLKNGVNLIQKVWQLKIISV